MILSILLTLASIGASFVSGYTPLPPSSDAFYLPPTGYTSQDSGSILSYRSMPHPAGINASIASTWQILVRSYDSQNSPSAVMTTLIVPANASPSKLLSLQPAYDSAAIDCSPSYSLFDPSIELFERIIIQEALEQGWYVNVPDYEGYTAAFTNGLQAGQAVIDSVRAALSSQSFSGLWSSANVVVTGVSGGALASGWALELQPSYASSLDIKGALLTSQVPNVTSVLETVDGTYASGLIPAGLLGIAKQYNNFSTLLIDQLVTNQSANFLAASSECGIPFAASFGTQQVLSTYLINNGQSLLYDPVFQSVVEATGIMGLHDTPEAPIFMVKGIADEISPVADTDKLVKEYCARGASVSYYRVENATHAEAGAYGFVLGFEWVSLLLDGLPAGLGCTTQNVTLPAAFEES